MEQQTTSSRITSTVRSGIGFGSALAIAISWYKNQSVLWAIFHGLLSWIYVIYHILDREGWIGLWWK
ncbi:MAG: hypothetical protein HUU10_12620 [Bacteroidetes bacterium]|nr:hypothetical protein [Bacteroidota bacterium]